MNRTEKYISSPCHQPWTGKMSSSETHALVEPDSQVHREAQDT